MSSLCLESLDGFIWLKGVQHTKGLKALAEISGVLSFSISISPQVSEWKIKDLQLNLVGTAESSQQKNTNVLPTGQNCAFGQQKEKEK